jgi:GT2 family glycosyltransferase
LASEPRLSVVITSYTTERLPDIADLLASLKAQTYPNIEIIFVAERSRELYDRVRELGDRLGFPAFILLFSEEQLGLGGARTLGAQTATGDIIAFVDDDVVLDAEWASEMVKSYEDPSVIGVTGSTMPLWQDGKLAWLPKELYWLISCTDWTEWVEPTEARSLWGHNMSVRREAFATAGHFSPALGYHTPMAEDLEFSLRVKIKTGGKLLFNPAVRAWHKVYSYRVGLKFVASRAHHIGVSRRLLRRTYLREQAPLRLERRVLSSMAKTLLCIPLELLVRPHVAWRRLIVILTVLAFAGIGYMFPGRALKAAQSIEGAREMVDVEHG